MFKDEEGCIRITHRDLGSYNLFADEKPHALFCENETNSLKLYNHAHHGTSKDGINDFIVQGNHDAVNKIAKGTKAAFHYQLTVPAGKSKSVRLRMTPDFQPEPFKEFNAIFKERLNDADEFFEDMQKFAGVPRRRPVWPPAKTNERNRTKFLLDEKDIPTKWYNIQADFKTPAPPVLHPGTKQPIGPPISRRCSRWS